MTTPMAATASIAAFKPQVYFFSHKPAQDVTQNVAA